MGGPSCFRVLPVQEEVLVHLGKRGAGVFIKGVVLPNHFFYNFSTVAIESIDHIHEVLFLGSLFYFVGLCICPYASATLF